MTTLTFGHVGVANTARHALVHSLTKFVAREWTYWNARRSLATLDDAALHDIGLGRSEIGGAVRRGRPATRRA